MPAALDPRFREDDGFNWCTSRTDTGFIRGGAAQAGVELAIDSQIPAQRAKSSPRSMKLRYIP